MTQQEIIDHIRPTFDTLEQLIAQFGPESFNEIPFEGSWTAGQCVQHIKLSAGTIISVLEGNVADTSRDPAEKLPVISEVFLNFETKMKSPDFIDPEMKIYDAERFAAFFAKFKPELHEAANRLDLTKTCLDFEVPSMGKMTRLEWIAFVLFHTQRHTHQLQKIREALA